MAVRGMSLRITEALHQKVSALAKKRGMSLNRYIELALESAAQQEERQRLSRSFSQIAGNAAEVESVLAAQSEVLK